MRYQGWRFTSYVLQMSQYFPSNFTRRQKHNPPTGRSSKCQSMPSSSWLTDVDPFRTSWSSFAHQEFKVDEELFKKKPKKHETLLLFLVKFNTRNSRTLCFLPCISCCKIIEMSKRFTIKMNQPSLSSSFFLFLFYMFLDIFIIICLLTISNSVIYM